MSDLEKEERPKKKGRPFKHKVVSEKRDRSNRITKEIIHSYEFGISADIQNKIEDEYEANNKNILDITRKAYGQDLLTEQSQEFAKVRRYISHLYKNVQYLEFTEDQRKFIEKNGLSMKPFEIAKTFFPDRVIAPLGKEVRTIERYSAAIGSSYDGASNAKDNDIYSAPNTDLQIIKKINNANVNADFDKDNLNSKKKECVSALRKYMNSPRFLHTINSYFRAKERDLFESVFVEAAYDKPDFTSEELNMLINLCSDYVLVSNLQKQMSQINELIDECVVDDEGKKLQLTLANTYSAKVQEYDKCQSRMQKLQESLSGKRSARLEAEAYVNESMTKLVEIWRTEEGRKQLLIIANARKIDVKAEMERIKSAPEYLGSIMGISEAEILD